MGSSPHTRGLHRDQRHGEPTCRIIPAHAGFTTPARPGTPGGSDHPRTRGVYPREDVTGIMSARIIPAHAGFTGVTGPGHGAYRDHPRTRGVYHAPADALRRIVRIIPAHAGFTPAGLLGPTHPGDHPRTRGVYAGRSRAGESKTGSSPHTRGLLTTTPSPSQGSGIIPAHAGFTSRGVGQDPPPSGSSPHTRGLLAEALRSWLAPRIIPAHAGFTPSAAWSPQAAPDHPRTRGVYGPMRARRVGSCGSSPHTRGLRRDGRAMHTGGRIIPAHAGFTSACHGRSRSASDHPRTRGVYGPMRARRVGPCGSSPHTRGLRRRRGCRP